MDSLKEAAIERIKHLPDDFSSFFYFNVCFITFSEFTKLAEESECYFHCLTN